MADEEAYNPLADLEAELWPDKVITSDCECPGCWGHPTGKCPTPATWKMFLHEIHGCDKPDLFHVKPDDKDTDPRLDGSAVRLVCDRCLLLHTKRAEELAEKARQVFRHTGGILVCKQCRRPLTELHQYLIVEGYDGAI